MDELGPELLEGDLLEAFGEKARELCDKISPFHNDFERETLLPLRLAALLLDLLLNGDSEEELVFESLNPISSLKADSLSGIPIVIGGITRQANDEIEFLSPGGICQTATNLAHFLNAQKLTIWTQQNGILSADPRFVSEAHSIPAMSYHEAAQIAHWNNAILHPKSLIPLQGTEVELHIRPFFDLDGAGTLVTAGSSTTEHLAKAVTARADLCLLVIEGLGMTEVVGTMARALDALAEASINVVLLSQASTEQSAGIVVDRREQQRALTVLRTEFEPDVASGDIERIYFLHPVGIVTAVDDHMRYRPGLTGKMFSTFGRSGINVLTIADGASENNLSAVVDGNDLPAAVQSLHEAFCLGRRRAHVFLFGAGTIGKQLLELMDQLQDQWIESLNLHLCLVGIANSQSMVWNKRGIPFDDALEKLHSTKLPSDLKAIVEHLANSRLDRLIVIDATASNEIARLYPVLLEHNIAVVTANKRANTMDSTFYQRLHRAAREHQVPYFCETTVGAGLPIMSTLRDLLRSGDQIVQIQGIVSGTLAFLFNQMGNGMSFGEALRIAYDNGYTEPDPRDDLSGEDVARKMLILAREMGLMLERDDIELEPLLSDDLRSVSTDEFVENMESLLAGWKPSEGLAPGERLHYIGTIQDGAIRVGIQSVGDDSPFAGLHGADNMIVFKTRRYFDNPLIVRGPGAGPAVTAAGVLADVIRAAELVT